MRGKERVQLRLASTKLRPQLGKVVRSITELVIVPQHPQLSRVSLKQKSEIPFQAEDIVRDSILSVRFRFRVSFTCSSICFDWQTG